MWVLNPDFWGFKNHTFSISRHDYKTNWTELHKLWVTKPLSEMRSVIKMRLKLRPLAARPCGCGFLLSSGLGRSHKHCRCLVQGCWTDAWTADKHSAPPFTPLQVTWTRPAHSWDDCREERVQVRMGRLQVKVQKLKYHHKGWQLIKSDPDVLCTHCSKRKYSSFCFFEYIIIVAYKK